MSGSANTAGQNELGSAASYWQKLLTAGRTDTAARSAPAINAELAQSDAAKRQAASVGTDRSGGTAAINREAGQQTQSSIDTIINKNLVGGQEAAAKGLTEIGGTELQAALASLGLSESAINDVLKESAGTYQYNKDNTQQMASSIGQSVASLIFGI
jgi:hypothetical protein